MREKRKGSMPQPSSPSESEVEACFEGATAAVEAAVAFVRRGPPLARVDEASVEEEVDLTGETSGVPGFEVRG